MCMPYLLYQNNLKNIIFCKNTALIMHTKEMYIDKYALSLSTLLFIIYVIFLPFQSFGAIHQLIPVNQLITCHLEFSEQVFLILVMLRG